MRYVYDNDLHIHSHISLCSGDLEQNNERILEYAKENNLNTICLANHFWDSDVLTDSDWYKKQNFDHINRANPLPQADGIRFLFGCETELDKHMTLGLAPDNYDKFDFIVIPTTHFHMEGFAIPEDCVSVSDKVELWFRRFNAVLDMDLPFYKVGMAHLTCGLIDGNRDKYLKIISELPENELYAILKKAAERGVGIELNSDDMSFSDSEQAVVLRPYLIAKDCGCKFYMGSDAHHPKTLDGAKKIFERTIDLLELTEADKFKITKKVK